MFRRGTVLTVVTIVVLICAVYAAAAHSKSKNKPGTNQSKPERCPGRVEEGDLVEVFYNVDLKGDQRVLSMQEDIIIVNHRTLNNMPTGLNDAVLGMCRGEKRKVKLLPEVAYGEIMQKHHEIAGREDEIELRRFVKKKA